MTNDQIVLFGDHSSVKKISSGFQYFLLIFALRRGLTLKLVALNTELNSLSNGDVFKGCHWTKNWALIPNSAFLVYSTNISC